MGLDMYLKASKYVGGWEVSGTKETFKNILKAANIPEELADDNAPSLTVEVNVGYWRKVNAIHNWFVKECGDGRDECQDIYVTPSKLTELRDLCSSLLKDRNEERAMKELSPQSGFFFGGTNVDSWYWEGLEDTVKIINKVLKNFLEYDIYYRASW